MNDFLIRGGALIKYSGTDSEVVIPYGVTKISACVFGYNQNIEKVVIPDSVTEIGEHAFEYCGRLHTVIIPDGVSKIGKGAFIHCDRLKDITLPPALTEIENRTFKNCAKLTDVRIPEGVTRIGRLAFYACEALAGLEISDGEVELGVGAFHDCVGLMDRDGFVIVKNVLFNYFGKDARVVVPEGVTKIDEFAFNYCRDMVEISIPASVERVSKLVFLECDKLRRVLLTDDKDEEYTEKLWATSGGSGLRLPLAVSMLEQRTELVKQSVEWKKRIKGYKKEIIQMAISSNDAPLIGSLFSLYKSIGIDELDSLIESAEGRVEIKAFLIDYKSRHYTLEQLEELEEKRTEKELGMRERTVADWRKIFRFRYADDGIVITGYIGDESDVIIPERIGKRAVVGIGIIAFWNKADVTSITLPEGIVSIGASAFYRCWSLKQINIPSSVTSIGSEAFADCISLKSINIPDGVNELEHGVFRGCTGLESVNIPDSIRKICTCAFENCSSLTRIDFPDNGVELAGGAFSKCINLERVTLSDSVMFNSSVFRGCKKLVIYAPEGGWAEDIARNLGMKFMPL